MEALFTPEALIALLTLTFLEVVLGVDNIIFISIVAGKLPKDQQRKARNIGLLLAMVFRLILIFAISLIISADKHELFDLFGIKPTIKDLILAVGGFFLIAKSTSEIYQKLEGTTHRESGAPTSLTRAVIQICLLNLVFSFDSILTAIGLTQMIIVMMISVVLSVVIMMIFAGKIAKFISRYPSLEILALAFLILIGFMLVVEGIVFVEGQHIHIPKGYIYFAVFFALLVETVNIRIRKKRNPLVLNKKME